MAYQKTDEQLLKLSKNKFYKFTSEEQKRLDDFLSEKPASDAKSSRKKSTKKLSGKTNVRVKNVVEKTNTEPEEV